MIDTPYNHGYLAGYKKPRVPEKTTFEPKDQDEREAADRQIKYPEPPPEATKEPECSK